MCRKPKKLSIGGATDRRTGPWDRSDGEIGCTAPARERHNIGLRLDISKTAVRQSDCAAPIAGHAQGELGVVGGRTNDARNGW